MARILIKGGYVVTINAGRDVFPGGSVIIDDGAIEAVLPTQADAMGGFDDVIDAKGMIVIPGLINAHQHFYYHLFKGIAGGLLIEDWFPDVVHRVTPHLSDDDMELTAWLASAEMLLSGTTCSLNHLRLPSTEATLQRIAAPGETLGIRQVIGKEVQCRLPGNPHHPRTLAEEISFLDDLIPRWASRSALTRLCLAVECNAIFIDQQVTSEELLIAGKRLADRHDLKITTHIAAGTLSFDKSYLQVLRKTGISETHHLMQLGLLDSRYILAHGINCSPADIRMIADSGASVVSTPTSEAVRGGGIGPVALMRAAGVNVALGSDGPMVDYSVDMIEQMKACSMLQHAKHLDPTLMGPERCLEMATINAAKALGLDSEIGSLEAGKRADIVLFDLATVRAMPANNALAALVYSARGTDAHTVLVNGEIVVRSRKLVRSCPDDLLAQASRRAQTVILKAGLEARTQPHW
ncbi:MULTISPECIES: amidohydrolase family protein [unclassified Beijerinckia]|uniref:amidohydrolase family protein n=1 Tax=unclassified Beijerinckia TaxID=2638183 RepID=UPI00089A084D|nr:MULTISPECIES: amidohydrolase family protein [unclassified Beijerinckia]MDH7798366.1 5-methylthioadenosine/S-adenosylhomocysteine deaminase [Beijerinckia sp. GAS462]SED18525.1 5-methylthioadenosine/S-adenosylhomocysteine deaminase [Beijerinckia sp. 28-YEA-48]